MGAELLIQPAQVWAIPLLAFLGLLIARRESRRYALFVLIASVAITAGGMVEAPKEHWTALLPLYFCMSVVALGFLAFIVWLVIHAIRHPDGDGQT